MVSGRRAATRGNKRMMNVLFSNGAAWFTVPAILGTLLFALRVVLMLIGGDADGGDADFDLADGDIELTDSGHAFEVLSIQSLAAFFMGFGWAGFAASEGFNWPLASSILIGVLFGAFLVWVLALMLKAIHDLQSSGNVSIRGAQGLEGDVYTRIPEKGAGRGQVRLIIQGRQRMYTAFTEGDTIESGTRIRVVQVNDDNTVTVARV